MPRPTTRDELLTAATHEFDRLWQAVDAVSAADRLRPGACDSWSVKDLLAHLDAWHELFLGWEAEGAAGGTPAMPTPGLSWKDTPILNARIHARTVDDPWDAVVARLRDSHARVLAVVAAYGDDLFVKRARPWTGSTSVGAYAVSATSSHYAWATKLIRAWARSAATPAGA